MTLADLEAACARHTGPTDEDGLVVARTRINFAERKLWLLDQATSADDD